MIAGRYMLRFDDICPTMNWAVWETIEAELRRHDARPILAVVPDNRDPKLMIDPPRSDFWERVRGWQASGYAIALHGYQHLYVNRNAGLMKLTPQSEFAGLPRAEQETKLKGGVDIFAQNGVTVDAWVAPAHSFDGTTVAALADLGVRVISDGLTPWPYTDGRGTFWAPQQFWSFRPKPAGVWTVCFHHNSWSAQQCDRFAEDVAAYAPRLTDLVTVANQFGHRKRGAADRFAAFSDLTWNHRLRPALRMTFGALRGARSSGR
jgi:predicted deacetylase